MFTRWYVECIVCKVDLKIHQTVIDMMALQKQIHAIYFKIIFVEKSKGVLLNKVLDKPLGMLVLYVVNIKRNANTTPWIGSVLNGPLSYAGEYSNRDQGSDTCVMLSEFSAGSVYTCAPTYFEHRPYLCTHSNLYLPWKLCGVVEGVSLGQVGLVTDFLLQLKQDLVDCSIGMGEVIACIVEMFGVEYDIGLLGETAKNFLFLNPPKHSKIDYFSNSKCTLGRIVSVLI
ncbi:MAG: hypothetical protein LBQ98_05775 [Nitrososphaerota archaeon]|nr:hypothetical protein [Nitrososphaerota archaeon]